MPRTEYPVNLVLMTTKERGGYVPPLGVIIADSNTSELYIGNGVTVGGVRLLQNQTLDDNGNVVIEIANVDGTVNYLQAAASVSGGAPVLGAAGDDTNVGLKLQAKGTGSITLVDGNTNELLIVSQAATNASNEVTIINSVSGSGPSIKATGSDANVPLAIWSKGTGAIKLLDGSGNEVLLTARAATNAVNEITITNGVQNAGPIIGATGDDGNIDLNLAPKGSGQLLCTKDAQFAGGYRQTVDGWYQDNAAANQTNATVARSATPAYGDAFLTPRAGSVTGISVASNAAITTGALTAKVTIAGTTQALTAALTTAVTNFAAATAVKDTYAFTAGQALGVAVSTSADFGPTTADIRVSLEFET